MEDTRTIVVEFRFTRNRALFLLMAFFLCWHPGILGSETLVMTTYYPAPYGGYGRLLTTGRTMLARDNGNVSIGGVGTAPTGPTDPLPPGLEVVASGGGSVRLEGGNGVALEFNDSNTKIGSPDNGNMSFYTGNSQRLTIDTSGNLTVGMGNAAKKELIISDGNLVIKGNGQPYDGSDPAKGGTGFLAGVCIEQAYGNVVNAGSGPTPDQYTYCPTDYPRVMSWYGSGVKCASPEFKVWDGAAHVDYFMRSCTGRMLCCRIAADMK